MLLRLKCERVNSQRVGLLYSTVTAVVLAHLSSGEVIHVLRSEALVAVKLETNCRTPGLTDGDLARIFAGGSTCDSSQACVTVASSIYARSRTPPYSREDKFLNWVIEVEVKRT